MRSEEIRKRFLEFFRKRGHSIIPSASLVPENDPSVLFNTAGMQPLVPYLLGEKHPAGTRLADSQKCVRTGDIDEIGDNTHATFFEMLGNWSLGDYFKEDTIKWSYEFLTSKEEGLGLDPSRLYVTVFEGNEDAPRDNEALEIWKKYIPENRIYFFGAKSNWWSPGDNGPCGPDTEMFYDVTENGLGDMTREQFLEADDKQQIVEIWNDVFMEFEKKDGKVIGKLSQKNVDTGAGLERLLVMMQKKNNIFDTDLFEDLMNKIKELSKGEDVLKARRIIADHIRTSVFMISDGVVPSNTDKGYILRRLLRRAVRYTDVLGIEDGKITELIDVVVSKYKDVYQNLEEKREIIKEEIKKEEEKFRKTLKNGLKEFEKMSENNISSKDAFLLFSTYGFPLEMTLELAQEKGIGVDKIGFEEELKKHQELSRTASAGMFKGGLADSSEKTTQYHTATHLLQSALRKVLGEDIYQKGSNITAERMRFDFSFPRKLTDEEIKKVEDIVNEKIKESLPVSFEEMPKEKAKEIGASGVFDDKYGDLVKVYKIGDFSMEICGGPHVKNTDELGNFKIIKEEAVSAGVRRIKAILE